jgi:AraC family transcriptional activator of tynA and feaB
MRTGERMTYISSDYIKSPDLNYVIWQDVVRQICGRYTPSGIEPSSFFGRASARSIFGLGSAELSTNAPRLDRTHQDVRDDAKDHYYAIFQVTGRSSIVQNERAEELTINDVALVDAARAVTFVSETATVHWRSLQLPRHSLVSHLGFEPQCPCRRRGAPAARALYQLLRDGEADDSATVSDGNYTRLAVYDLLGALFAPSKSVAASAYTDKLFGRICRIINVHFTDPNFGPTEVAREAHISLRYLQKLFTERNLTCSQYIASLRLNHAATLLERRSFLKTKQPAAEIAYASGFDNYTVFIRQFRRRFGHTPSSHSQQCTGPGASQFADDR